jgi:phosphoglycolate phosphatase
LNRLAVFDCDGTLVDSAHTIYIALGQALTDHGIGVPPPEECRRIIGLNLVEAIAALLPWADRAQHLLIADTYKSKFHALRTSGGVCEPMFDGILDLLHELEEDGWMLAVATGKSDRGLRLCLESHDIHARFVSLQTADRHPSKPNPSMVLTAMADAGAEAATTVVIGDTLFDMGMAAAAGAYGIGAAWGYHEREDLLAGGASAIAETPADVLRLACERVGTANAR